MGSNIEELYRRHIKPHDINDRRRLLALVAQDLAPETPPGAQAQGRNIMELHGLGAEIWQGVDAQDYVNELRDEWDRRP